jgi:hypothetical protein
MTKRAALASLLLLMLVPVSLFAASQKLVDDVIRLSKKGISDDVIIALIDASLERAPISADDVIALSEAGVSKAVIQAMIEPPADATEPAVNEGPATAEEQPPAESEEPPADSTADVYEPGCVTFDPPIVDATFDPPYPAWLWNPYWYMPTLDTRDDRGPTVARTGAEPTLRPAIQRDSAPPVRTEAPKPTRETPQHETTARKPESSGRTRDFSSPSRQPSGRSQGGRSRR